MNLVTFLDEAPYPRANFSWKGRTYRGRFAPAASVRFLRPKKLIVFLTEQAFATIYQEFLGELPSDLPVINHIIPPGSSEQELWDIARQVIKQVDVSSNLAFDISHGPLSFSLIGLLSAVFIRTTQDIELDAILYAAYGIDLPHDPATNKPVEQQKIVPLFDLREMLFWLEWFNAIERFSITGESQQLDRLLKAEKSTLMRQAKGDQQRLAELGAISKLSGVINGMARALHMIRPDQVLQYSADLPSRIEQVQPLFDGRPAELSHGLLESRLLANFSVLGLAEPDNLEKSEQIIATQRQLINWYAERDLWVEANTLAREWLVSWTMYQLGQNEFKNRRLRSRIENVLGAESQDFLACSQHKQEYQSIFLKELPEITQVLSLWLQLTEVRNDINHAGMRPQPGRPEDLIARSKNCIRLINLLPL